MPSVRLARPALDLAQRGGGHADLVRELRERERLRLAQAAQMHPELLPDLAVEARHGRLTAAGIQVTLQHLKVTLQSTEQKRDAEERALAAIDPDAIARDVSAMVRVLERHRRTSARRWSCSPRLAGAARAGRRGGSSTTS